MEVRVCLTLDDQRIGLDFRVTEGFRQGFEEGKQKRRGEHRRDHHRSAESEKDARARALLEAGKD